MTQPLETTTGSVKLRFGPSGQLNRKAVAGLLRLLATRGYLTPDDLDRAFREDASDEEAVLSTIARFFQRADRT